MTKREIIKILIDARSCQSSIEDTATTLKFFMDVEIKDLKDEIKELRNHQKHDISELWGEELYDLYPPYLSNEIKGFKSVAKGLGGHKIQDLFKQYVKDIDEDHEIHIKILADLTWAIKNKAIMYSFSNFVLSKDYIRIAIERNKGKSFSTESI